MIEDPVEPSDLRRWPIRLDRRRFWHALRTAVAATVSLVLARIFRLPEPYWVVVTTVIVMQSTLGAAWSVSLRRLFGTAVGGITAVTIITLWGPTVSAFAIGLLAMALVCALLPFDDSAYRFAGVTLAIIMLPQHNLPVVYVALHRFFEVSFGIVVAMAVSALWHEATAPVDQTPPELQSIAVDPPP